MGSMASAAADDFKIGVGLKEDVEGNDPQLDGGLTGYQRRTQQRKKREADAIRDFQLLRNDDSPASQPAPPRAAPAPNYGIGAVAAAPSVPDPDAIGETEQALLDAQKKGRSSTITTSSRGLLSDEDDTRKKRSLMGGLIS
mgnify:CR=1